MTQVTCKLQVQVEKHIIWDSIIEKEDKFRPYLGYILDKEVVIHSSRKVLTIARQNLNKRLVDCAKNAIDFLNSIWEDNLKKANSNDIISIITSARKGCKQISPLRHSPGKGWYFGPLSEVVYWYVWPTV